MDTECHRMVTKMNKIFSEPELLLKILFTLKYKLKNDSSGFLSAYSACSHQIVSKKE